MAPPDCLKIFSEAPENKDRVDHIDSHAPDCICEREIVSEHCNEPVGLDEVLVRLVVDDTHIVRENGAVRLRSSFMSDALTFGSSSLRLGRAAKTEFQITIEEMLKDAPPKQSDGTPREVIGYVRVPVAMAKSYKVSHKYKENGQEKEITATAFGVYATGVDKRPNHADIMSNGTAGATKFSRSARNRQTVKLSEDLSGEFRQVSSVDEILALGT